MISYKKGDVVWCTSLPSGNKVSNYTVGKLYTLKEKSYTPKGRFEGWLTEENSFWVIREKDMELYEEVSGQND